MGGSARLLSKLANHYQVEEQWLTAGKGQPRPGVDPELDGLADDEFKDVRKGGAPPPAELPEREPPSPSGPESPPPPERTLERIAEDDIAEALRLYPFDQAGRYAGPKALATHILVKGHERMVSVAMAESDGAVIGFDEPKGATPAQLALAIVERVLHGRAAAKGKAIEGVELTEEEARPSKRRK